MKEALIADLKAVHAAQGKISRKLYRIHGTYSENQLRKNFGSFGAAVEVAGINAPQVISPVLRAYTAQGQAETQELVGDSWNVNLPNTHIKSLPELLEYCKVDEKVWKVKRFLIAKKDNILKGEVVGQSFNITASFFKDSELDWIRREIDDLKAEWQKEIQSPYRFVTTNNTSEPTGYVLEINIPDLHLGKLAWAKETGYVNYDSKIAVATFKAALDDLLAQVAHYKFDYIIFVVGNDLLNADNAAGTTTAGTPQQNDHRFHKMFVVARNMLKDAILRLREIAPVKVISCPGNHDRLSAWHITDSLQMFFEGLGYPDVEVDNGPETRKYHQYGKNLIMFTHGDSAKREKLPLTMAAEKPRMWGDTKYRECHTGHIHQTKTEEYNGVRVRVLPALCPPDAWHSANAFVGNLRVAEAYVWSKEKGLKAEFFYNAD